MKLSTYIDDDRFPCFHVSANRILDTPIGVVILTVDGYLPTNSLPTDIRYSGCSS